MKIIPAEGKVSLRYFFLVLKIKFLDKGVNNLYLAMI